MDKTVKDSEVSTIGDELLDGQHQTLLNIANSLLNSTHNQEQSYYVNALLKYAIMHFNDEEHFMQEIEYPYYEIHKRNHEFLIKVLSLICDDLIHEINHQERIKNDLHTFISRLLLTHFRDDSNVLKFYKNNV